MGVKREYVAGWNMPGYLPEMEPVVFDREVDALDFLADEIDRMICELEEAPGGSDVEVWSELANAAGACMAQVGARQDWSIVAGGLVWWVQVQHRVEAGVVSR